MNYGFVKVATAIPTIKVADCIYNARQIESLIAMAEGKGVQLLAFPELSLTAATCGDLFAQQLLLDEAEMALIQIVNNTRQLEVISIIGMPVMLNATLLNAAVVIQKGKVVGVIPKTYLPNYKEFSDQRWFCSANEIAETSMRLCGQNVPVSNHLLFDTAETCFGVELSEDLWAPIPPSSALALQGAEIIFNLSADAESIGRYSYLRSLVAQQSARCICGYVLASSGFGESTTDVVFGGKSLLYENGVLLEEGKRFTTESQLVISEIDVDRLRADRRTNTTFSANRTQLYTKVQQSPVHIQTEYSISRESGLTRTFDRLPFVPQGAALDDRCEEIFAIQTTGLAQRLVHTHAQTAVIGISGGLDSTLALLVTTRTFDKIGLPRKNIIGVTMPGFGTTDRTYTNALTLMQMLGISIREISIKEACIQHFQDIQHDIRNHDTTYENSQARERTQLLMDIANQVGGMVIGTGDLSELALGWATYNGDHMSMYGVNGDVPKTLVKHLVQWVATHEVNHETRSTLLDIVDTPISPELIPAEDDGSIKQKTEDLVGPYELHDFFLYYFLRYGFRPAKILMMAEQTFKNEYTEEVIRHWLSTFLRRFFNQQFKRSCLPDGPKIGSVAISPRGSWKMPSDATSTAWLNEIKDNN